MLSVRSVVTMIPFIVSLIALLSSFTIGLLVGKKKRLNGRSAFDPFDTLILTLLLLIAFLLGSLITYVVLIF